MVGTARCMGATRDCASFASPVSPVLRSSFTREQFAHASGFSLEQPHQGLLMPQTLGLRTLIAPGASPNVFSHERVEDVELPDPGTVRVFRLKGQYDSKTVRRWSKKWRKLRERISIEKNHRIDHKWHDRHNDRGEGTPGWDRSGAPTGVRKLVT